MALPINFEEYALDDAQEIINKRTALIPKENLPFLNGDHWGQNGEYWVGPRLPADDPLYQATLAETKRVFVSQNVTAAIVGRHVNGVLSKELHWKLTPNRPLDPVEIVDPITGQIRTEEGKPTDEENTIIAEAEAALVEWWDKREVPEILQSMLEGALAIKRSPLRLHVPSGLRDDAGNLPPGTLAEVMDYIYLQHMGTNEDTLEQQTPSATVYTDKNTRRDVGVFTYKEEDSQDEFAELSYADDAGLTVLRIVNSEGVVQEQRLPLGGRLTLYEMTRHSLITPQILSQQKALNMAKTMQARNDVQGGYLERILLNVQWPGEDEPQSDGTTKFVPKTLRVGAGTTNAFAGYEYTDENGVTRVANPSVVYRDPVSPQTFIDSQEAYYLSMLESSQQLHYATVGDGVISGESRKQARSEYEKDLLRSAGKVEAAARWVLETVLAMASVFAGQPGRFEGLRAYVQARVDSGPIGPDEMRVASEMWDRGLWAKETAQSATGIEDVDAENNRIEQEDAKRAAAFAAQSAVQPQDELANALNNPANRQNGQPQPQNGNGAVVQ